VLRKAGVPVAEEVVAADRDAALAAAAVVGFPLVMKLRAPGLLHKSDLGAISLGVRDEAGVRREADRLFGLAAEHRIDGADLVVAQQVPEGLELLIGMHATPCSAPSSRWVSVAS
jgi:acyl-CoA synthetase (NDP forming)